MKSLEDNGVAYYLGDVAVDHLKDIGKGNKFLGLDTCEVRRDNRGQLTGDHEFNI